MKTLVTVEMAEAILRNNTVNRAPSKTAILFLSKEILSGRFLYNGEPILISKTNRLLDGQHRLMAIIEANMPVYLNIVRDIDDDVMHTIDTGRARRAGDVLSMAGVKNYNIISAGIRNILNHFMVSLKKGANGVGAIKHSNGEILEFYNNNKELIEDMMDFATDLHKHGVKVLTKANVISYSYLLSGGTFNDTVQSFMRELFTGQQEGKSNAAVLLHRKLSNNAISSTQMRKRDIVNHIIYAYKKYIDGQTLKKIAGSVSSVGALTFDEFEKKS